MQRAATLFARYPLTTHPRLCLAHRLLSNAASASTNDSLAEAAPVRINKLMSSRDMCSRREADRLVAAGKVFVDGEMVASAGLKVHPVAQITIAGMDDPLYCRLGGFTVVLHKPCGFVSNQAEHGHTPAMSLLTSANRAPHCRLPLPEGVAKRMGAAIPTKGGSNKGLAPLGRLDLDSSGLLIFSNNGVLAKKLIGSNNVEKEYEVVVARRRRKKKQHSQQGRDHNRREHWRTMDHDREHLREITNGKGVVDMEHALAILNGGMLQLDQKLLRPAVVERRVGTPLEGMEFLQEPTAQTWTFVLTEGRKRQIRRMCALVGVDVIALRRLRVGQLWLGDLRQSQWQVVQPQDILGGDGSCR